MLCGSWLGTLRIGHRERTKIEGVIKDNKHTVIDGETAGSAVAAAPAPSPAVARAPAPSPAPAPTVEQPIHRDTLLLLC